MSERGRAVSDQQRPEPWFLIREHANGWIGQIEASDVPGKWHVAAYAVQPGVPPLPINGYVAGESGAKDLADTLVNDHAPHECDGYCGRWRRSDDQRESA